MKLSNLLFFFFGVKKQVLNGIQDFCIPIFFNNPLKATFSNKNYTIAIQTHPTQIVEVYFSFKTGF